MYSRPHQSSITGRIDVTHMLLLGKRRAVRVYLPPDYESTDRSHPVLYMFDGHNLFDRRTSTYDKEWEIDETLEALSRRNPSASAIVVGIDAPQDKVERYSEYTICDWEFPEHHGSESITGYGHETARFLVEEVKPWVESAYRVAVAPEAVGIGGSSMGGYMALYTGCRYPGVFGRVLAFSPVAIENPMRGEVLRDALRSSRPAPEQRFYLDMGDAEVLEYVDDPGILIRGMLDLADSLQEAGATQIAARVIADGRHDETAWGSRFEEVLLWAFFDGVLD